jgi:hypothetical protein
MSGLAAVLAGRRSPGVYLWRSNTPASEVAHAVQRARWHPLILDGRSVTSEEQLLDAIAATCGFPSGSGRNWDALADCLTDLSWLGPTHGFLLLYDGWGMLARTEPEAWSATRSVFEDTCKHWAATQTAFAVLLRGPGPDDDLTELR